MSVIHCQHIMQFIQYFTCFMFNTVWPHVKYEMSSSYSIMFLTDVLKKSGDISACYLIEYETHVQIFLTCGKTSVENCQSQLSKATDWFLTACLSLFYHLLLLLGWKTVPLMSWCEIIILLIFRLVVLKSEKLAV